MEKALIVAVVLSAVDKMSKVIDSAVNQSTKSLTRLSKETSKLGTNAFNLGRDALALGVGIGAPLFMAAQAAEESEQATRKLEQVFKSMGETSGKSAKKAQEFAESLMMDIAVDDEKIIAVQTKLATFEKVIKNTAGTSEIFERATRAAFDLEAAGFGEGTQNATQLGKALQDPIKGITALSRSGVTFTATEKEKIKALVESGQQLKAQRLLMDAVEKQVKGVAKANVTDTMRMKIAWGELVETIGGAVLPILSTLSKFMIANVVPALKKFIQENPTLVKWLTITAAAIGGVAIAVSALSFVFGGFMKVISFSVSAVGYVVKAFQLLGTTIRVVTAFMIANPLIAIITGIAIAATLIYIHWDKVRDFFIKLWEAVKRIFRVTWDWIKNLLLKYTPAGLIYKHWGKITSWFGSLWDAVKSIFRATWEWIKNLFLNYTPPGLIYKHWSKVTTWFSSMWAKVRASFNQFITFVLNLGSRMYAAGAAIVNNIWEGMKAKMNQMVEWFKGKLQELRNMLPFSPAKSGPLKDIHRLKFVETIATNIKPGPIVGAMNKALSAVRGAIAPKGGGASPALSPAMAGAGGKGGGAVTVNFSPTFNMGAAGGGANAKQDFIAQLKQYQPELMRVINDALSRKERAKY